MNRKLKSAVSTLCFVALALATTVFLANGNKDAATSAIPTEVKLYAVAYNAVSLDGNSAILAVSQTQLREDIEFLLANDRIISTISVIKQNASSKDNKRVAYAALIFEHIDKGFFQAVVPLLREYNIGAMIIVSAEQIEEYASELKPLVESKILELAVSVDINLMQSEIAGNGYVAYIRMLVASQLVTIDVPSLAHAQPLIVCNKHSALKSIANAHGCPNLLLYGNGINYIELTNQTQLIMRRLRFPNSASISELAWTLD